MVTRAASNDDMTAIARIYWADLQLLAQAE